MWSNPKNSNLVPSQVVQYLGVIIDSTSFRVSPSEKRISRLQSTAAEFQSCASPPASLWLSLLGVLSSLAHLVPGGRLRMRSLQLCLHRSWDRQDLEVPVYASMGCLRDLRWWLHLPCLSLGVSLCQVSPDLHFWSDASDVGLHGDGAHTSSSTLGPAPLVLRPAPAFAGSSSGPAGPSRPLALASVSSSLPGSPSAQASCLATLQRFTRAAGFSSAVAEQSSLARRPSSRAVYQVRWSIYRAWCHNNGHSISRPTLAKVADFLYGCGTPGGSVFPPCVVTVQCYLRCSVFTFHPCLRIR